MQFRPHRGRLGYWLVPTLKREFPNTVRRATAIVERVILSSLPVESTGGRP
jgi:hypothetical protein